MTDRPDREPTPPADADLHAIVERIAEQPDQAIAWASRAPQEASRWFLDGIERAAVAPAALVDAASLGAAAVAADGRLLARSPVFAENGGEALIDIDAVRAAARAAQPLVRAVAAGDGAQPGLVAYGNAAVTANWQLPDDVRHALAAPGAVAVIASFAPPEGAIRRAAAAYGLSGLQERVCAALIATGDVRSAATACGIAYATAREAVAGAMTRTGVAKLPELVTRLTGIAYGVLPDVGPEALLVDMWGLTPRQATLAQLVAGGQSREAAARAMGISLAVAKKEMDAIYGALEVGTAAELARSLAGMSVVAAMLRATAGSVGALDPVSEPLRFALRDDGSRVAYSDYGPPDGRPVLVVHSSMTTRIVSRRLLRALQERGFRPVSIDRPGFGLSDVRAGDGRDPFEQAADDVALVSRRLRIGRWDVVARGGAQAVMAIERAHPGLLGHVVLVNPDPRTDAEGRRAGPLGFFKELYWRNPPLIRAGARLLASQLSGARFARILARSVRGSPPDEAALALPGLVEDYHRSVRAFATGRIEGYVAEQQWFAGGPEPEPIRDTRRWRVLIGAHDMLHDPNAVGRYWRRLLPDAAFETVAGQGRLMALAAPDIVADALVAPRSAAS